MYDAVDDPYTYENSTVLISRLDLKSQSELDDFEAEISSARAREPLPAGDLDFAHYCAVHHHLFQDVYERAGKPRTVRIAKQGSPFCFPENIEAQATRLFSGLKAAGFLKNQSLDQCAANAAQFVSELNAIHAFREGNGRAQLTFLALLADRAGHPLNIEKLDPEVMLSAMIGSFEGDELQLGSVIASL